MSAVTSSHSAVAPLMKDGCMTMLALDQRGSMRTIIARGRDEAEITDDQLSDFKAAAVEILSPMASAVLLDSSLGRKAMDKLPPGIPLILSADRFEQQPGGQVERSLLDPAVTPGVIDECNAVALKLLVIWSEGAGVAFRRDLVGRFVDLARKTGRIALVEGIVRNDAGGRFTDAREHGEAVLQAAIELVESKPDVYKAEVPGYLPGQFDQIETYAARLTETLAQPWVVLSNGVAAVDFKKTVELCCKNGASGFLAGRAIWADAASSTNPASGLQNESVGRLKELVELVRTIKK
jgi:sulfofructosephosphate aldolase